MPESLKNMYIYKIKGEEISIKLYIILLFPLLAHCYTRRCVQMSGSYGKLVGEVTTQCFKSQNRRPHMNLTVVSCYTRYKGGREHKQEVQERQKDQTL